MTLPPLQVPLLGRFSQSSMPDQSLRNLLQHDLRDGVFLVPARTIQLIARQVRFRSSVHARERFAAVDDFGRVGGWVEPWSALPVVELEVLEPLVDVEALVPPMLAARDDAHVCVLFLAFGVFDQDVLEDSELLAPFLQ